MSVHMKEFDLTHELHQTIVKSLTTSFGLDFSLFKDEKVKDKKGGNVDTIHKVREYQQDLKNGGKSDIHVSEEMKSQLSENGINSTPYNSHDYHGNANYKQRGKQDKAKQNQGELHDTYRNDNLKIWEKRELDHVVSAYEIHNDAGRILADIDGVSLANQNDNLSSTLKYINIKKSNMSMQEFVNKLPEMKQQKQESIKKNQAKLASMSANTPEERNKKRKLEDDIRKDKEHLKALESVNSEAMLKKDQEARKQYNQQVNWSYYTSNKFFGATAMDMGKKGFAMGRRQALGLVLAEIWFELKEQIPQIYRKCRANFQLDEFMSDIGQALKNIWERIKTRFKDMLHAFKDGVISGALASLTTTMWNTLQIIGKNAIKIIRETWNSLVQAIKLIFFNPNKLSLGDLSRELTRIIGTAASVSVGTIVSNEVAKLITEPYLQEGVSAFVGALVTGVLTVGLSYFLDHSPIIQKVWDFLNSFKNKYERMVEHYQEINAELDRYLLELSKIEFNMNPQELSAFADRLAVINNEYELGQVLAAEVQRRNIELPFEAGNTASTRAWLSSLAKKS